MPCISSHIARMHLRNFIIDVTYINSTRGLTILANICYSY